MPTYMSAIAASKWALARTESSSKARSRSRIARVRWSTVNTYFDEERQGGGVSKDATVDINRDVNNRCALVHTSRKQK